MREEEGRKSKYMLERNFHLFIGGCVVILFLPFLYLFTLAYPVSDDINRALLEFGNFFQSLNAWLLGHNGRYFNAVLCILPVYNNILVYQTCNVLLTIFLGYSLNSFFKEFLEKRKSLVFSGFCILYLFLYLPDHGQYFYWYATQTAYVFSIAIYLIFAKKLIHIYKKNRIELKEILWLIFLLFIGIGSHELFVAPALISLFLLSLYKLLTEEFKNIGSYLFLNVYALLNALAIVFIPGSQDRQEGFDSNLYDKDFVFALTHGVSETLEYYLFSFINIPFLIFFMLAIFLSIKWSRPNFNSSIKMLGAYLLISILIMIGIHFIFTFSTGKPEMPKNRIYDYFFCFFILQMTTLAALIGQFINQHKEEFAHKINMNSIALIGSIILIFVLGFLSPNLKIFIEEYNGGIYSNYDAEINDRLNALKGEVDRSEFLTVGPTLILPPLSKPPKLLYYEENVGLIGTSRKFRSQVRLFHRDKMNGRRDLLLKSYNQMKSSKPIYQDNQTTIYKQNGSDILNLQIRRLKKDKIKLLTWANAKTQPKKIDINKQRNCFSIDNTTYCMLKHSERIDSLSVRFK